MNRREFVTTGLGALALGRYAQAQPAKRPNIVFILADDLGWGDLGAYGNRAIKTPNLDKLARAGTTFTQFYSNGSVCSPSRTSWMTGHFPARHKIHGHLATEQLNAQRGMPNFLDPTVPNVAQLLKNNGYTTGHIGKWHLGSGAGAPHPKEYGFDYVRSVSSNDTAWSDLRQSMPHFWARSMPLLADESIQFIERNKSKPFSLQLWTMLPHATLAPTESQMEQYRGAGPGKGTPHRGATEIYYASVTDLDTQLGRVFAKLDELGLADNTLILFSSDNGPEEILIPNASHSGVGSAGPLRGRKRSLYEGGVCVPFLVRWPGKTPAGKVDNTSVVTANDFLPTVAQIIGAKPEAADKLDGESCLPALTGKPWTRTKPIYWEWRFRVFGHPSGRSPILSVRDGKWKLLFNPDGSRTELYDMTADRPEQNNVAAANPAVVKQLKAKGLAWQKMLPAGPFDSDAGQNNWPRPGERT